MWIARDILGLEPKVYVRKIRGRVVLGTPEPNTCVRFIVDAMAHLDPIKPNQLPTLERRLSDLLALVPEAPIAIPISREN